MPYIMAICVSSGIFIVPSTEVSQTLTYNKAEQIFDKSETISPEIKENTYETIT